MLTRAGTSRREVGFLSWLPSSSRHNVCITHLTEAYKFRDLTNLQIQLKVQHYASVGLTMHNRHWLNSVSCRACQRRVLCDPLDIRYPCRKQAILSAFGSEMIPHAWSAAGVAGWATGAPVADPFTTKHFHDYRGFASS